MQQLQTVDTFGHSFALAKIAAYRDRQAEHREALGEIDNGIRHLDPGSGSYMVDITERYRQRHLDAIADLERWVRVWERDLMAADWSRPTTSHTYEGTCSGHVGAQEWR